MLSNVASLVQGMMASLVSLSDDKCAHLASAGSLNSGRRITTKEWHGSEDAVRQDIEVAYRALADLEE